MRIAIQVSGQQRYGQFFAEFIASLTPFGEIDVFFHHWDGQRSPADIALLVTGGTVKAIKCEPQIPFSVHPDWKKLILEGSSIFNLMSMTYGIRAVNQLRIAHERTTGRDYDLVIRTRSDVRFIKPPQLAWLQNIAPATIYLSEKPRYLTPTMVQDQFAIGRSAAMTAYADLFTGFDRYYAAGHRFHPETYFRWFIASAGLHIDEADISLELDLRGVRWREDRAIY